LLLATNTRVGIDSPWRNTIRIESFGHGKRLRLWVELCLKTNSCNFLISLCKVTIIIVEHMTALSPGLGQYVTELGKQISCVLSFFLSLFSTFAYAYNCHPRCFGCLIILVHTSSILFV